MNNEILNYLYSLKNKDYNETSIAFRNFISINNFLFLKDIYINNFDFNDIYKKYNLHGKNVKNVVNKHKYKAINNLKSVLIHEKNKYSIYNYILDLKICNILSKNNIKTIDQLSCLSDIEILNLKDIGKYGLKVIVNAIDMS